MVSTVIRAALALWLILFLKRQFSRVGHDAAEEVSAWRRAVKLITPVLLFLWSNRRWMKRLA
ncbi:MAG: hypothetical protein K8L99_28160 [Anaerolineae bacterium]|nr:hypothetical protein [Anaerolineae bacterium]